MLTYSFFYGGPKKFTVKASNLLSPYSFLILTSTKFQVINWVQTRDAYLGINKRRVIVMGDGSGGALAAAVSILHQRNEGKSLLDSTADLQPPLAAQVQLL